MKKVKTDEEVVNAINDLMHREYKKLAGVDDYEHYIQCHKDELPERLRSLSKIMVELQQILSDQYDYEEND